MTVGVAMARPVDGVGALRTAAAFAAIYLFWGGTFLALRWAVAELPPLLTIAIRCGAGALVLYAWGAARGELARATALQWRVAAGAGALLFVGCHGLLAWAEQRVTSGQAALLLTSIPLWLVLFDSLHRRRLPSDRVLAGLAVGVLGIAVLTSGAGSAPGSVVDRVALVLSGLFWAAGSLLGRDGARPASALQSTAMQLAAGAGTVLLASALTGELGAWTPAPVEPSDRIPRLPRSRRNDPRLRRLHLAAARGGAGRGGHLRVRQPGDRGPAGLGGG